MAATIAGLVTRMLAEDAFDRAETRAEPDRARYLDEGHALEMASLGSWIAAGALVIGGLTGLYLLQLEREQAEAARYAARRAPGFALGVAPGGVTLHGRF